MEQIDKLSTLKITFFQIRLLEWFKKNKRHYSWRNNDLSPYGIIISEILLQRTKADTIAKFFDNFLIEFPDWHSLANSPIEKIQNYLKPVGLYIQRAKRLYNLANYMVINNGNLPTNRTELNSVPFMGQYIANAVELLIFKRQRPLLDVNMARLLERFFGERKLADIRYDPYLQYLALQIVRHSNSKEINWAILDFAALICKARKPLCEIYTLKTECLFYKSQCNSRL